MIIEVKKDGTVVWFFYRKVFRKSRWRKVGQRELNCFLKYKAEKPEAHGLIIVC